MAITGYERMAGGSGLAEIIRERQAEAERKKREAEEAERKRKMEAEAALLASLRRQNEARTPMPPASLGPIGDTINKWRKTPVTVGDVQDQVMGLPIGPRTEEQSRPAQGLMAPIPPRLSLPKPQVGHTAPTVSTGTPDIGQTPGFGETITSEPPRSTMLPSVDPNRPDPVIRPPSQIVRQGFPTLASFGGAPLATAQPELPRYLPKILGGLANMAAPAIGNFVQSEDFAQNVGQMIGGIPGAFAALGAQLGQQVVDDTTPLGALTELTRQRIAERNRVRESTSMLRQQGVAGTAVSKLLELPSYVAGGFLDIWQAADEAAGIVEIPGTNRTAGQIYATAAEYAMTAPLFLADPMANIRNAATYWDAANRGVLAAVTPTTEQLKAHTPEEIQRAKSYALLMAHHGVASMAEQFDNFLDFKEEGRAKVAEAARLAQQADQIGDPRTRQMLLYQAGQMGFEGEKMLETSPLELYDKNQDWRYSLPFEILFGFTNAADWLSSAAKVAKVDVSMAGRRAMQGKSLMNMPQTATAQARPLVEVFKDAFRTQRSDVSRDAYANFTVMSNIMGSFAVKGDIIKGFQQYIRDAEKLVTGMPIGQFTTPGIEMQAVDGMFQAGWAGIRDWRAVKARKSIQGMEQWVPHFPSLMGDPNEIANKIEVMGDLMQALVRASAQKSKGVLGNKVGKILAPYGTAKIVVLPTLNGQAKVQFLDQAKQVITESSEMAIGMANAMSKTYGKALKEGQEFASNWARAVGGFERNLLSTFVLNPVPGSAITNAVGTLGVAMGDMGFQKEFFHTREEKLSYLMNKVGGMMPFARGAEGVLDIGPQVAVGTAKVPTRGYEWMDWLTGGLSRVGRKVRQGDSAVGEEGLALNIYYTAFKNFIDRELSPRIAPVVKKILAEEGVNDPKIAQWITDRVVQAGLSGGRQDVARTFNEIANGRIAPSLRTLHDAFAETFTSDQVFEIDNILATVTEQTLPAMRQRLDEILELQRNAIGAELAQNPAIARKWFWTAADDAKDVADIVDQMENAAKQTGRDPQEGIALGKIVEQAQGQINESMWQLLNMSLDNPGLIRYVYNTWGQIKGYQDELRMKLAQIGEKIQEEAKNANVVNPTNDLVQDPWQVVMTMPEERMALVLQRLSEAGIEAVRDGIYLSVQAVDATHANQIYKQINDIFQFDPSSLRPMQAMPGTGLSGWYDFYGDVADADIHNELMELFRLPKNAYRNATKEQVIGAIQKQWQLSDGAAEGILGLLDARAKAWSLLTGLDPRQWYADTFAAITRQPVEGALAFVAQTHDVERRQLLVVSELLFGKTTEHKNRLQVLIHELGHVFQNDMMKLADEGDRATGHQLEVARQWAYKVAGRKAPPVGWDNETFEVFANGFLQYVKEGITPSPELASMFERFKEWILTLWDHLLHNTGAVRAKNMTPEIRRFFDEMLGGSTTAPTPYVSSADDLFEDINNPDAIFDAYDQGGRKYSRFSRGETLGQWRGDPPAPYARTRAMAADAGELPAGTEALWRKGDTDTPVVITKLLGEQDGVRYYAVKGSNTGVPETELVDIIRPQVPGQAYTVDADGNIVNLPLSSKSQRIGYQAAQGAGVSAPGIPAAPGPGLWQPPRIVPPSRPPLQGPVPQPGATKAELWEQYWVQADAGWKDFGKQAIQAIEQMRNSILDGTAMENLRRGVDNAVVIRGGESYEDMEFRAFDLMSNLGFDIEVAKASLGQRLGWQSQDPNFVPVMTALRKGIDKYQAMMFTAMSKFPNQKTFDEVMDAFADVRNERVKVLGGQWAIIKKLNGEAAQLDPALKSRYFDELLDYKNKAWPAWFEYAWDRYYNASLRIMQVNLPDNIIGNMTFKRADGSVWRAIHPDVRKPLVWHAEAPNGKKAKVPVGLNGVPQAIVDQWELTRARAEKMIADQIAYIAGQSAAQGTGVPQVDAMLQTVGGKRTQEMMAQIRASVMEWMANYEKPLDMTTDVLHWNHNKLEVAGQALQNILPDIAKANGTGFGRLGMQSINRFNKEVLPLYDNIISGAQRYGDEMVSVDVLDFTNEYHPDVLLGLGSPYHFYWSRMGKNALERLFFNPKIQNHVLRFMRTLESENRAENQPDRNLQSIPNSGPTLGDVTYNIGGQVLARWIPVLPLMAMNGWADPDRANRAYEYAQEAMKEQGFPATARTAAANAIYYKQLAEEMGLSFHPWWDWLEAYYVGAPEEISLADLGPIPRMAGWASVLFGEAAQKSGNPLLQGIQAGIERAATPFYAPYLYAREGRNEVVRGNITEMEGQFAADVGNQQFTGREPLPEQELLAPNAPDVYNNLRSSVATEYLIREFIRWATGVSIMPTSEAEQQVRGDLEQYRGMGYSADNPAGSAEGKYAMTDPTSPAYAPGVATSNVLYNVTNQEGVNQPADVARPGLGAAQGEYYRRQQAIYEKYTAEREQAYAQNPSWGGQYTPEDEEAFDKSWDARREAELNALKRQFPTVVDAQGESDASSYANQRPAEDKRDAENLLYRQAGIAAGEYPTNGSNADKERWVQRRNAEVARLMQNPGEVDTLMKGNLLPKSPTQGWQIMAPAGATSNQPATPRPVAPASALATTQQAPAADPKNQWAEQMATAEQEYGLPAGILQELARHESGFKADAFNDTSNASGMFQFVPSTWGDMEKALDVTDPQDPDDAIAAAAYYVNWIRKQLPADKRDDAAWIAAAYNLGVNAVKGMASLDEIIEYSKEQGYPDGQARLDYARDIGRAVGGEGAMVAAGDATSRVGSPFSGEHNLTQSFGVNPERYKSWGGHMGLDYSMPVGTELLATEGGTVVDTGYSPAGGTPSRPGTGGFGNWVIIEHPDGYVTEYAHLSRIDVEPGDTLEQGQVIGLSGHTGVSDFPHLHFGVRKDGEYIDPTGYLARSVAQPAQMAAVPTEAPAPTKVPGVAATTASVSQPSTIASTATGSFDWGKTPEQLISEQRNEFVPPSEQKAIESQNQAWVEYEDNIKKTYPQYAKTYDGYQEMATDAEKKAYREAHPEMKAMNLLGNNPDEWSYVEKTFGKGIVEKWAFEPPSDFEGGNGARGAYYRQYPDAFLAKSWIQGRPQPYSDVPNEDFAYNFGKDYEQAKQLFGPGIWDVVRDYYATVPKWVEGAENAEWKAFKNAHPEYDAWSDWWYQLVNEDGSPKKPYTPYERRPFVPWSSWGRSGGDSSGGFNSQPDPIRRPESRLSEPPRWQGVPSDGRGDWQRWMELSRVDLEGWRR